jgi:ribosomal RNA assembly protein
MALEIVRIPEERKPALIGKDGKSKALIERKSGVRLRVRQDVEIEGPAEKILVAKDIVKAIGRGFSPKDALGLLKEGYQLVVITLRGEKENTVKRLMGRVIGRKGTTRHIIERETGAKITVFGKTVAIIGDDESSWNARQAVEELLSGRTHGYVYRRLIKE